jgi:hypothetical protein
METRAYYEKKKTEFANRYSYYGNRDKKWGEKYGYTLEPPMKLETLEKYENTYNLKIPEKFRDYLLNISSETIGYYPYKLKLNDEPMLIFIHETRGISADDEHAYDEIKTDVKKLHELGYYENYFIKTHENGCTDDDFLCVKGPKYGRKGSYIMGGDFFSI